MSALTPDLFTRRFRDFLEIGHARLRPLAPDWTDHNAHDPGITFMELLAWVAEAQLYSLSRLRRDERASYAALIGLQQSGTTAARGILWGDRQDPNSPFLTFARSMVLPADTVIKLTGEEAPVFRPTSELLWAPGSLGRIATRHADGRITDHTVANARDGAAFGPLGDTGGPGAVLTMSFTCRDEAGLFGTEPENTKRAPWAIGYRSAPAITGTAEAEASAPSAGIRRTALEVTLVTADQRTPLPIVSDTTEGLLTTGTVLLDLSLVEGSPSQFTLEFQTVRGSARAPRALRLEPNVIPIQQGRSIAREPHLATGEPDWHFTLEEPGLRFAAGEKPVTVEVSDPTGIREWRAGVIADLGPDDEAFELDHRTGQVTFGNGVNGCIPRQGADVLVTYAVCDGERGRVARNRKWRVGGFPGAFGVNLDPVTGGAATSDWIDERRKARRSAREDHALVSPGDIIAAAKRLPLLDVARAWIAPVTARAPRTGTVRLIAMLGRPDGVEPAQIPETARWLETIRRQLIGRMPLGTRLEVIAPRYVDFSIDATLEVEPGRDPGTVRKAVDVTLNKRLALVSVNRSPERQFGVPVTERDVGSWLRSVPGVSRVVAVQLRGADRSRIDLVQVRPTGLPRHTADRDDITVRRPAAGGAS
jgi:predicted phage baseplate assembly protein